MRARLALVVAGINVELREINLRDKANEFLACSPKGTVPVLVFSDGSVLDESVDIVNYICSSIQGATLCLSPSVDTEFEALYAKFMDTFLPALYRYKYPNRYVEVDVAVEQAKIKTFMDSLEHFLQHTSLLQNALNKSDVILFPFVRQVSIVDQSWFDVSVGDLVKSRLQAVVNTPEFEIVMRKQIDWVVGNEKVFLL
jgi:glutathione S-transferase